jgi:hypothetical protein
MEAEGFWRRLFAAVIPALSRLYRAFDKAASPFVRLDGSFSKVIPYLVILGGAVFFAIVWVSGASLGITVFMQGVGVMIGLVTVFFMYRSLSQERQLQLFDGEQQVLQSEGAKTYAVVTALGDRDVAFSPVRSTIHLTNLGIVVESGASGETALFVPIDKITEFAAYQGGIRIRFLDVKHAMIEVMVYVEDRDLWMKTITDMLGKPR